ncbi:MAG TPA: DUF2283 domain-containing protein [Thiobacillus sp.]|nr:DUF2283 domain-containing protein [Thiobacillus sp.]
MREREIDFAWLAATMDAPETIEQHPDDPTLIYAFRRIPEFGNRVLRVVYNQTKEPPHIVDSLFRPNGRRQTMRFDYDPQVDALYIRLNEAKIIESEEVQPGIILDFDENGKVAGVEVLDASKRNTTPAPARKAA